MNTTHRLCLLLSCGLVCLPVLPLQADWSAEAGRITAREAAQLETATLENGLQVILKPDASAPVISVQFWIHSGSIHESPLSGSGVAHAIEHMIFKGTTNLPPGELSRRIEDAGGSANAYTTFDRTVYYADVPARNWQVAFDLYAEALFAPAFAQEEWQSERDVIRREIAMGADQPARVLSRHVWQTALQVSPYRHPVIGYTDTFLSLTRKDLVAFHRRHYTPANTTIVIVGDMDPQTVQAHIQKVLGTRLRLPRAAIVLPEEPAQVAPRHSRFTGDYQLTRTAILWNVPAYPHPDTAALAVLARIAGSGRTSRLQHALVEASDHFLQISAWHFHRGFFGVQGMFRPDQEQMSLEALQQQIDDLRAGMFTPEEVARAVRMMLTDQLQSFTSMSGQAAHYGHYQHLAGDPTLDQWWIEQLATVTPAEVERVARTWLAPARRTQTVLAPHAMPTAATEPPAPQAAGKLQKQVLPNGMVLLIRPAPRLPFVYLAAALQGGLLSEETGQAGSTALMADLLTRGTVSRSRDDIALAIESRGASLTPFSGFNAFGLTAEGLRADTDLLLELVHDCLLNPTFPEEELERQRARQIASIRNRQDQPMALAMDQLRQTLFQDHPYRNPPAGTMATVQQLGQEQIRNHHQRLTTASNLVLAVFGDVDPQTIRLKVEATFADMPPGRAPSIDYEPVQASTATRLVQEAPQQQAIVLAGAPAVDLFDPDYEALALLQTAMSGLASNLSKEIRETRGLAYFTGASQQAGLHPGFFAVYAGTAAASLATVETLLHDEMQRIREQGLTPEEHERALARMLADHEMGLQNQMGLALKAALHERYGLGAHSIFQWPDRLQAVTPAQIQRAAQRILAADRIVTTILRPEQQPAQQEEPSDAGTVDE